MAWCSGTPAPDVRRSVERRTAAQSTPSTATAAADQIGGVERAEQRHARPSARDACTVCMTWMPAMVAIWVMSCWVALAVPSES